MRRVQAGEARDLWEVREVAELGLELESHDTQALGLAAPGDLNMASAWHLESKTKIGNKRRVHYVSHTHSHKMESLFNTYKTALGGAC